MTNITEVPIKPFKSASAWQTWLSKNHGSKQGLWLKIAKKDSGIVTVTYDEALDAALCYGWIDGQKKTFDENYFLQKFTPRRPRSLWSKRNVAKVEELIKSGKMQPTGLVEFESAKKDGRLEAAYVSPKNMEIPKDFVMAVKKNKNAFEYFKILNKTSQYIIAWRLQTAKTPETRKRRFENLLQKLINAEIV